MNAIISNGDYTALVQLPVDRKQLAGALSYLGANHTSDYDLRYNEENKDGLKVSLECFGVVENAIAKVLLVGFRFHTLNDALTLMGNLPYLIDIGLIEKKRSALYFIFIQESFSDLPQALK